MSPIRRVIGSWLAVSMSVMALSACTSGPMTMAEMVCCAEHHDDCEMAGQAESCCAPDSQSDMGVLAVDRTDTTHAADAASHWVGLPTRLAADLTPSPTSVFTDTSSLLSRFRPRVLSTVLLI